MGVQVKEGGTPMELARISSMVSALYFVGRADVTGVTLHLKYLPGCCEEGEWVQEGEGACRETSSEGEVVVQAGATILVGALALVLKESGWKESQDVFRGRIIGAELAEWEENRGLQLSPGLNQLRCSMVSSNKNKLKLVSTIKGVNWFVVQLL